MQRYDWDHIDPNYPESADRSYQMVCGLTNSLNLVKREQSTNVRKSNRFLPWRVAQDEIGSVPVNPGDLCQFLDRASGEWVLEEFLGEWWFEQTRDLCGAFIAGQLNGLSTYENKTGMWGLSPDRRKEILKQGGLTAGRRNAQTGRMREVQKLSNKSKYLCLITFKTTTSGPLTLWQRARKIDTSFRVPLKTVYFLIRSLYLV
jgi:hypothetical protein